MKTILILSEPKTNKGFYISVFALVIALILSLFFSQIIGAAKVNVSDLYNFFMAPDERAAQKIIGNLRMPRAIIGMFVGAHFAIAGLLLQAVLRNPLADPTIFGVSSGASLAVIASIFLISAIMPTTTFLTSADIPIFYVPFIAFFGALLATFLVFWLSWEDGSINPKRMALGGVILGSIMTSAVMAIIVGFGQAKAELAIIWMAGSLYGRSYNNLIPLLPWSFICVIATLIIIKPLSVLRFDDDIAQSMGLNVKLWRMVAILISVGFAASAVSVVGPVGFVGLIIPHLAKLLVGGQMFKLIIVSALLGALLIVVGDLIGRSILVPLEVPIGAITSLIGVPIFLIILQKSGWKLK